MARFSQIIRRKRVHFTNHALDRWWEREADNAPLGRQQSLALLRERLNGSRACRDLPNWARVSVYHRAVADHFVDLGDASGFVVNRNSNGDLVAVTYINQAATASGGLRPRNQNNNGGN